MDPDRWRLDRRQDQISKSDPSKTKKNTNKSKPSKDNLNKSVKPKAKLSFKDKHRLDELDKLMPALGEEISALETAMADPDLYASDPASFQSKSTRLGAARTELEDAELEWLALEEKREAIEAGSD